MPVDSVTKLRLANGLAVHLKEIHTAPLVSQYLWYRVGSRYELPGSTGISHWVEHMQFKGTPQFPNSSVHRLVARLGGSLNAFTSQDMTAYYFILPSDEVDLALQIEADRMANTCFDPEQVEAERDVILSERQGDQNEPSFRLHEEIMAVAFRAHPYRNLVIGDEVDLRALQAEDLYRHYRRYYRPNNAILTLAGDFETDELVKRIQALFEPIPAGDVPPPPQRPEPPQTGERRVTVEGPGETTFMRVVYHSPLPTNPDYYPLLVAMSLLTGANILNLFGGGLSHKSSRLYRVLIDKEITVTFGGSASTNVDPALHGFGMTVHPNSRPEIALQALDDEIHRLQDSQPSAAELARTMKQARALFAYGSESIQAQCRWLGYPEIFATSAWFETYMTRLQAVTPADVQQAAQIYLRPQIRTVGVYHPTA